MGGVLKQTVLKIPALEAQVAVDTRFLLSCSELPGLAGGKPGPSESGLRKVQLRVEGSHNGNCSSACEPPTCKLHFGKRNLVAHRLKPGWLAESVGGSSQMWLLHISIESMLYRVVLGLSLAS